MDHRQAQSDYHRPLWGRENLARLCPGASGRSRWCHRGLQTDARLFEELGLAHGDGRFPRLFHSITKAQLLILNDWAPDRLTATQRRDLMEIVKERYGRGSIMITSQLPITVWHEVIGEPTFADTILDRIVHIAYCIELEGASKRKTIARMNDEMPQT